MTTYENPYGLGFERATEEGPDVEFKSTFATWVKRPDQNELLCKDFIYRRPIKLQVGHRYVRRDEVVVRVLKYEQYNHYCMRYLISDGMSRDEAGRFTGTLENSLDLVTHIEEPETKEEQMKDTDTVTVNNVEVKVTGLPRECVTTINGSVSLTYAQIEAAHAEMMRQKAENEIKRGDIVKHKRFHFVFIVGQKNGPEYSAEGLAYFPEDRLEKVTGTPEFMSELRAVLERK